MVTYEEFLIEIGYADFYPHTKGINELKDAERIVKDNIWRELAFYNTFDGEKQEFFVIQEYYHRLLDTLQGIIRGKSYMQN